MLHRLLQQLLRNVDLHGVFEGLRDSPGDSGDTSEDVDRAALNAVLGREGDVLVLDLQRHRNQHRVARHLHVIGADLKRHQVDVDLVADDLFQVLELDWRRRLHLGQHLQLVELLGCSADPARGRHWRRRDCIRIGPVRQAHLLVHGAPPPGVCSSASFSLGSLVR